MRLFLPTLAFLSFLYVGHAAPSINCESLTQKIPIESTDQILGKWMFVAETVNIEGIKMMTKKYVDSAFVNVTSVPESSKLNFFQAQRSFGKCLSFTTTSLVANNTLHSTKPYRALQALLTTGCPDCLVIEGNFTLGSTYYQSLQLLSRRRTLNSAEQDEFKKQAECLKLPAPVFMDPERELCSEQATSSSDITAMLNSDIATQIFEVLDSAINSEGGIAELFNSFLGNLPILKQA